LSGHRRVRDLYEGRREGKCRCEKWQPFRGGERPVEEEYQQCAA